MYGFLEIRIPPNRIPIYKDKKEFLYKGIPSYVDSYPVSKETLGSLRGVSVRGFRQIRNITKHYNYECLRLRAHQMVANHSAVDKFLQVSLFGCLGGRGAVVIATNMGAGIVSRHLCGNEPAS